MKPLEEHLCNKCFYQHVEGSLKPCAGCSGYDKYLPADVYFEPYEKLPKDARWQFTGQFGKAPQEEESFGDWLWGKEEYDVVNRPKHYVLFEDEGIEVRDVIEKLVGKMLDDGNEDNLPMSESLLFSSDYVQMMQYLMRFMDKGGAEDLKKGAWYLDKLIEAYDDADDT